MKKTVLCKKLCADAQKYMGKITAVFTQKSMIKYLIKSAIYIVIFFIILCFLWQFLLDESLFDVLMDKSL